MSCNRLSPTRLSPVPPSATEPATSFTAATRRSDELEAGIVADPAAYRILTGDRPTGPLHVGHYFGTLRNRVRLQDLGVEVLVLIADYQVLTDRDAAERLPADVLGQVADYLAIGIDPERSAIFAHSQIAALNQLVVPFLSLVSVAELARNPTVKDEFESGGAAAMSALMLAYPVHQAADILFCGANVVPVGRDQLPHLELTRTIARRFNDRYGAGGTRLVEPEALLSSAPLLLGTDGRKMSKSRGNAIALRASADETAQLVQAARTDGERLITYEPDRRPEVANLVQLAALCIGERPEDLAERIDGGAAALKRVVTEAVNERFRAIRAARESLGCDPAYLRRVLFEGRDRAEAIATATLDAVRAAMHTSY